MPAVIPLYETLQPLLVSHLLGRADCEVYHGSVQESRLIFFFFPNHPVR